MSEARILAEDSRVELVEMTPIGSRHVACVDRQNWPFLRRVREAAIVRAQNPIRLDRHSELQPDLVLARPKSDFYAEAHPGSKAILLVVGAAETSAGVDREVKVLHCTPKPGSQRSGSSTWRMEVSRPHLNGVSRSPIGWPRDSAVPSCAAGRGRDGLTIRLVCLGLDKVLVGTVLSGSHARGDRQHLPKPL